MKTLAIERFLKDIVKGGWNPKPMYYNVTAEVNRIRCSGDDNDIEYYSIRELLLDPNAWQAVGKTRGWKQDWVGETKRYGGGGEVIETVFKEYEPWEWKQHHFIDHIADDKTIEEGLIAIE